MNGVRPALRPLILAALLILVALGATVFAAGNGPLDNILPLDQVKPGMRGEVYTIIEGDKIEKLDLEVIGILPNLMGPQQDIILVKLVGERASEVGVAAGMSGSPVYIDGKLVGALSLKFGIFTKEALGGVTPIAHMMEADASDGGVTVPAQRASAGTGPARGWPPVAAETTGSPSTTPLPYDSFAYPKVDLAQETAATRQYPPRSISGFPGSPPSHPCCMRRSSKWMPAPRAARFSRAAQRTVQSPAA
jgi:hypothetical protein